MTAKKKNAPAKRAAAPKTLKDLINSVAVKKQIAKALPEYLTPERFVRTATTLLLKSPGLAMCSQESFMQAMMDCASMGIEPDGRRAHLIPYGEECNLIVDYKGIVELAKRCADVKTIRAESVCENDSFSWRNGEVDHEIDWFNDRSEVKAYYSEVVYKDGFREVCVMRLDEILGIRDRSKGYQNAVEKGKQSPWMTDESEMCKKTVIRRHSKMLTLSPEFGAAVNYIGDDIEFDQPERNVTPKKVRQELDSESNPFEQAAA